MRVVHIVPVFPPYRGGMGNVAFHETQALADAGVEVTVFTTRTARPPLRPRGVEVVALPPLVARGNAACLPQVLRRIGRYDVVHLHYPFFGTAELVAAQRVVHGPPLVLQYQMDVVGQGWRTHVFRWHRRLLLPLLIRAADAIIVTSLDYAASGFLARWLPALRLRLRERLVVIPAGVDLTYLSPNGTGTDVCGRFGLSGRPLIFFLATLDRAHYFKGLHVLLEALQCLPEAALLVGGDGDLRRQYEAQTIRLGLTERVRFVGDIPSDALPSYYRAADVVAVPSVDRTEAFGLVLLEAMACGKPVVASRLPGVRTLVTDGLNGYLAEPRSPVDLAEKIRLCMQNAAALGAHGRRVAEEHLNWSAVAQRLLGLYEHLTRRPGRTAESARRD